MIIIPKTPKEIKKIRRANKAVAEAHQIVESLIKPGISTLDLELAVINFFKKKEIIPAFLGYRGFPAATCLSINEEIVHGIPSKEKILQDGDIIAVDIGSIVKKYYGDAAKTHPVGNISEGLEKLLFHNKQALYEAIKVAKPGNRIRDIADAIKNYATMWGYEVVTNYGGHGIGKKLHEEPFVPNEALSVYKDELNIELVPRMTLAIEPMFCLGSSKNRVLEDNWTVVTEDGKPAAHFEHTIAITEEGNEILSSLD